MSPLDPGLQKRIARIYADWRQSRYPEAFPDRLERQHIHLLADVNRESIWLEAVDHL